MDIAVKYQQLWLVSSMDNISRSTTYEILLWLILLTSNQADIGIYTVGQNDQFISDKLRLNHIEYPSSDSISTKEYVVWMKTMLKQGYAVTICVYMNHYLFYLETNPNAGDREYDHIVTLREIESDFDDNEYHDTDIITIADHGLWASRS